VFEARYPGRCNAECGEPIEVGDLAQYDPENPDRIVHERCAGKPNHTKGTKYQGTSLEDMGF
jgi:hypothetical protein